MKEQLFNIILNRDIVDYPYGVQHTYHKGLLIYKNLTLSNINKLLIIGDSKEWEIHGFGVKTYFGIRDYMVVPIEEYDKIKKDVDCPIICPHYCKDGR